MESSVLLLIILRPKNYALRMAKHTKKKKYIKNWNTFSMPGMALNILKTRTNHQGVFNYVGQMYT